MTYPVSRRRFLTQAAVGAAGLAVGGALARSVRAQGGIPSLRWQDLTPKTRAILEQGGNALVILGAGGATVLVDTKVAPAGKFLREMIDESGRKVTRVINTHHHADHTGGNWVFTPDTPVLAHVNCPPRIAPQMDRYLGALRAAGMTDFEPSARMYTPTETMGDEKTLDFGGLTLTLRHVGPAHTDNDVVVLVQGENVLHTGDLVFNGLHPFIDVSAGATTEGWIRALEQVEKMCDASTIVVPGHGDIGGPDILRTQIRYFEALRKAVQDAIDSGKSLEEITKMQAPGFEDYGFAQMRPRALEVVYNELTEK